MTYQIRKVEDYPDTDYCKDTPRFVARIEGSSYIVFGVGSSPFSAYEDAAKSIVEADHLERLFNDTPDDRIVQEGDF